MKVLFSSTSGYGHIIPMLQLARAFGDSGHDVLWATANQALPLVMAAGVEGVPAGAHGAAEAALRGDVRTRADELPGGDRAAFVFPRMFGEALTPPMARDLLDLARDWGPDLLVHEHAELAAPLVGAVLGVPSITHSFGTAVPVAILDDTAARLAPLWREHGLDVLPYAGCFRAGYLDICPPSVQTTSVDHIARVQPLRRCPRWVRRRRRRGTRSSTSPWAPSRTVPSCCAKWSRGSPPCRSRCWLLSGRGPSRRRWGNSRRMCRVESWVDQAEVLSRCSAVVSHAGSGTFLGALARGLPQLCLPQAADQFRNAEGGIRAGAALVLGPAETTSASVRTAVERLLSDPRAARRRVARDRGDAGPDEVVRLLT